MTQLTFAVNSGGQFPELQGAPLGIVDKVGRLPRGMTSGKSSIIVRIVYPNGTMAFGECSLKQLDIAVRAFKAVEERS